MNRQQRRLVTRAPGPDAAVAAAALADQAHRALVQGQPRVAVSALRRLVVLCPQEGAFWRALGQALVADGRPAEAVAAFTTACERQPDAADILSDRGMAYLDSGQGVAAGACHRAVIAIDPVFPGAYGRLASALKRQGRFDAALAAQCRAVATAPDDPHERFNLALLLLSSGRFDEGWAAYEARLRLPGLDIHTGFAQPQWAGEDIARQTLLVHAEQGLGDVIQFCRYLPLLTGRARSVLFAVPPALVTLLRDLPGVDALC